MMASVYANRRGSVRSGALAVLATLAWGCSSSPTATGASEGKSALTEEVSDLADAAGCVKAHYIRCGTTCIDPRSDLRNCGGCGILCTGSGVSCTGGRCLLPLASNVPYSPALVVDSSSVYWADALSNVMKVGLDGGVPFTLSSSSQPEDLTVNLALSGSNLVWTSAGTSGSNPPTGSVQTLGTDGGTPLLLGSVENSPQGLVTNKTLAFWSYSAPPGTNASYLVSAPLDGGAPKTLATLPNLAIHAVVDTTSVYAYEFGDIISVPLKGGTVTTLASGYRTVQGLALDGGILYWTNSNSGTAHSDGTIVSMPITGGTPTTLATGEANPFAIAVHAGEVYWTDLGWQPNGVTYQGMSLRRKQKGKAATTLISDQSRPYGLAIDATSVYYTTDAANGVVMKLTPR